VGAPRDWRGRHDFLKGRAARTADRGFFEGARDELSMGDDGHNKEAIALDALDALDGEELRELRAHLASCAECGRERDALRDAASMLAYAAPPAAPGAHVRERLFERVRELGPASASANAPASPASQAPAADSDAARVDARVLEFAARPRAFVIPKWLAVAASLVIAVMAVALAALWRQNSSLRGEVARVGAELNAERGRDAQQQEALERSRQELLRAGELNEMLASPGMQMASLAGTKDAPPGARASIAYNRAMSRAVLIASGLPPAPEGKAYQVWYIDAGKPPVPGGTFKPNVDSRGFLSDRIPPEGQAAQTFAVTLEPEGGVPAPTGKMYLLSAAS
jgi:hypothetical protein